MGFITNEGKVTTAGSRKQKIASKRDNFWFGEVYVVPEIGGNFLSLGQLT